MIDFSKLTGLEIPEGTVYEIKSKNYNQVIWEKINYSYVSLGDSIAVGHRINENWETDYGWDKQYGKPGQTQTALVTNCYTDLIKRDIEKEYNNLGVKVTSFAQSGDTVEDLMKKLSHERVQNAIKKANLVTVCIGANDVLTPVLNGVMEYLSTGNKDEVDQKVDHNLSVLNTDDAPTSYIALFNQLKNINNEAKFVFTTVYNPHKYLYLDGTAEGFIGPLFDYIPELQFDIPYINVTIDISGWVKDWAKDAILNTDLMRNWPGRINKMSSIAEGYVTDLDEILRTKLLKFQETNTNFMLADTKAVFDPVPDRQVSTQNNKHYNDLVNVQFTRGYDIADVPWGNLWEGSTASSFWYDLVAKHLYWINAFPSINPVDYVDFHAADFVAELLPQIIEKVVEPNIDPHPRAYGHHALYSSFSETLGWLSIPRRHITFNANGGNGTMSQQTFIALDNNTISVNLNANIFTPGAEGYYFNGWNTKADGSGTSYTNGQLISVNTDLTLYAQWNNEYEVTIDADFDDACRSYMEYKDVIQTTHHTGVKENYCIQKSSDGGNTWTTIPNNYLNAIDDTPRTIKVRYKDKLRVCVKPSNYARTSWPVVDGFSTRTDTAEGNVWHIHKTCWEQVDLVKNTLNSSFTANLNESRAQSQIKVNHNGTTNTVSSGTAQSDYNNGIYAEFDILGNGTSINFKYFEPMPNTVNISQNVIIGTLSIYAYLKMWDCDIYGSNIANVKTGNISF